MKAKPKVTDASALRETLEGLTIEHIKPRALFCASNLPTRKNDLIDVIVNTVGSPAALKKLWAKLDDLSQKAIAAALANKGNLDSDAFRAQYGELPWDRLKKKNDYSWRYSYRKECLPIDVLLYNNRIPPDLITLLKPLAPKPERFALRGLDVLPEPYAAQLLIGETESAALHDLAATLGLIAEGKAAVTRVTSRPTTAALAKLGERLLHGEFLPEAEYEPIRAFGWLTLVQDAKLAQASGSKLTLTPKGQKVLTQPGVDHVQNIFQAWATSNLFDELSRIRALKGQKARGARFTRPSERKGKILDALMECPIGGWIEIEEFFRAVRAWRCNFEVELSDYYHVDKLYVGDSWEYGYLGGFGAEEVWRAAQAQYILVCLWEYLATLGLIDIAYCYPEESTFSIGNLDDRNNENYFSPYVGLSYFRINTLGAYLLELSDEYSGASHLAHQPVFTITANYEVAITRREGFTPNVRALLERVAEPVSEGIYKLQRERILTALETGSTLDAITEFLSGNSAQALPQTVMILLDDIGHNSRALQEAGTAVLFNVSDAALAQLIANDSSLRKLCSIAGETTLVVPAAKEAIFRRRIKQLGYGIRH